MGGTFSFRIDRSRGLIQIAMAGLFTLDDIAAFLDARRDAHSALGCAPNAHLTLNDLRGMKIQSQEVVAAFRALLAVPEFPSRRLAFVAGPTLARSQLMRALDGRAARCFEDMAEAEAWLFEGDHGSAPLRRVAGSAYFPSNVGGLFCTKAMTPDLKSSVRPASR